MTQVSSTSNSESGGATLKGLLGALLLLVIMEALSPGSLRYEPSFRRPMKRSCDVLIVGDSRSQAITPNLVAQAWSDGTRVEVFSLVGSHIESVTRFAMDRQQTRPRMLVMCVTYAGYFTPPHNTVTRLNRLDDASWFAATKNWLRETARARLVLYLDQPAIEYAKLIRSWLKGSFAPPPPSPSPEPEPGPSPPPSRDPEPKPADPHRPVVTPLEMESLHYQYRNHARRVVPRHRHEALEAILKQWQQEGTSIVFLRLPIGGDMKVIEDESPYLGIFKPMAERHGIPFIDLNEYEWVGVLQENMPDEVHIWGDDLRADMSLKIGEILVEHDPARKE